MEHFSEKCEPLISRTSTFCTDQNNKWKSGHSTGGLSDLSHCMCWWALGQAKEIKGEAAQNNPKSPTHFNPCVPSFLHLYIHSPITLFFKCLPVLVTVLS